MRTKARALAVVIFLFIVGAAHSQTKRIYIANDDHTDYVWSGDEATYRNIFINMLDFYLNQADSTLGNPTDFRGRFNADGNFWLWTYEKNKSNTEFLRLIDRIRNGYITIPLQTLVMCYGAMPAEAVLRSMYYAGRIERKHNLKFELVSAMENQTLNFGLPSLWAGSGAKYSWKGVCGCASNVTGLDNRGREMYHAQGPDGRSVLMKWYSFDPAQFYGTGSGGYAEARNPAAAVDFLSTNAWFLSRYPFPDVAGAFGYGWDDLQSYTNQFITTAQAMSTPTRRVIVSNQIDFFKDFELTYPSSAPTFSGGFGNEWELHAMSMAEVTASVKRSVEDLRSAEALAAIVSYVKPGFMTPFAASADSAFVNMGLFYEHDWTMDGPVSHLRPGFQRRTAAQIANYVASLKATAKSELGKYIDTQGSTSRFYVFNPLGWVRTDVVDVPISISGSVKVIDVGTTNEVRSQRITRDGQQYLRVLAGGVPSIGYKVYEIQSGATSFTDSAVAYSNGNLTFENPRYKVSVTNSGAINSLIDKSDGNREWVASLGGRLMNDLGTGSGTVTAENGGPVSATIYINAGGAPAHRTRVTLFHTIDRVDIENEITSGFGSTPTSYSFGVNISGHTIRHEEIGAIATAKPLSMGGSYSDVNARHDYFTMNHFVDVSDAQKGLTISNWDSPFFKLGNSSGTTIDMLTPQIQAMVGTRIDGRGAVDQDGDSYFKNRYSLRRHGIYDQAAAMRFALEHQNPLVPGAVTGELAGSLPTTTFSLLSTNDPNVLVWSVKPAEEGLKLHGLIARVWNLSDVSRSYELMYNGSINSAKKTTHIETDIEDAGIVGNAIVDLLPPQGMQTYRLKGNPDMVVLPSHPKVAPKFFLEGGYDIATSKMKTNLKTSGTLNARFAGKPVPSRSVDSIAVEIRDSLTVAASTIVRSAPAWLLDDGNIVDLEDTTSSFVEFEVPPGDYYLVVRHRNHIPVMSPSRISISGATPVSYDFSTGQSKALGVNPMAPVGSVFALVGGDASGDGQITSNDFNIFNPLFVSGSSGYSNGDMNLDGFVTSSDFNLFLPNFTSARRSFVP